MSAKRGPYRKCYLVPHGRGFKYCRAVPKDLQPVENKKAWVKYLGAVSRPVAETMAHALAHEHGQRILAHRCHVAGGIAAPRHVGHAGEAPQEAGLQHPPPLATANAAICPPHIRTLSQLVSLWEKVRAPRSSIGRAKARLWVRRFVELVGNLPAPEVTRAHGVAYRDALEAQGMKSKNVTEHLGGLHVLFAVAVSEGLLDQNPLSNIKARESAHTFNSRRQGFTVKHVGDIFGALSNEADHFRWIVRLLAYHGMRSGEACQLRCEDVAVLHGVQVLRIHDLHGSVKNRASVRDIPIHPACKGIVGHASRAGEGWLFPTLPVKRLGRGRWFQDYGSRFLRTTVGITDRRYTMHSFRHLWRTLARECEMPESVSRSIMGHSLGIGEHGAYGTSPSLKVRAAWIERIDPLGA